MAEKVRDVKDIKKDRLRYTKNTTSATLAYVAILFGALYFVSIYQSDVNNYYYTITIGLSVLYNLVFLLMAFLASEGLKNYKIGYAYGIIGIGILQIARIFGIPMMAHNTLTVIEGTEVPVMANGQFVYVVVCLLISAAACILAGIIGAYKSITLANYKKEKGLV